MRRGIEAREAALQMLYQWEIGARSTSNAAATTSSTVHDGRAATRPDGRCSAIVRRRRWSRDTVERLAEIDALIAGTRQNWRIERMAVLDRLILRLAVYELLRESDDAAARS